MNFFRAALIVLLTLILLVLVEYAPLVPKLIALMDDVHEIRGKEPDWAKRVDGIQSSIDSLNKKFNFFKEDARRKGYAWPDD